MSNEKNPASLPPKINFDEIDRRISERYDRNLNNVDETASIRPPSQRNDIDLASGLGSFGLQTPEPTSEPEQKHLELNSPFIILQFEHEPVEGEENIVNIKGFQLNAEGLDPNPQSILVHLKMVVENIEEQIENGDINDSVTE